MNAEKYATNFGGIEFYFARLHKAKLSTTCISFSLILTPAEQIKSTKDKQTRKNINVLHPVQRTCISSWNNPASHLKKEEKTELKEEQVPVW